MGAIQTSFGTTLSPNSSIGLGFKLIHQNLSPFGAGIETSDGASTGGGTVSLGGQPVSMKAKPRITTSWRKFFMGLFWV